MTNQLAIYFLAVKDYMLPCLNKQLFGIDCPGCGLQRSVLLLFNGEFIAAFKMYPAIYPIITLVLFLIFDAFFVIKKALQLKMFLGFLTVAVILGSYIIKMNHFLN